MKTSTKESSQQERSFLSSRNEGKLPKNAISRILDPDLQATAPFYFQQFWHIKLIYFDHTQDIFLPWANVQMLLNNAFKYWMCFNIWRYHHGTWENNTIKAGSYYGREYCTWNGKSWVWMKVQVFLLLLWNNKLFQHSFKYSPICSNDRNYRLNVCIYIMNDVIEYKH